MERLWDIRRLLILLTRSWWWPLGTLFLSFWIAWAYLRYTTSIYKSDASIQIDLSQSNLVKAKGGNEAFLPLENLADMYAELFTTYNLIERAVEDLRLEWEIYSIGRFGRSLLFPHPFTVETDLQEERVLSQLFPLTIEVGESQDLLVRKGDRLLKEGRIGAWLPLGKGQIRIVPADPRRGIPSGTYFVAKTSVSAAAYGWQSRISAFPKRGFTVWVVSVTDISPTRAQRFLAKLLEHAREYERSIRQTHYQKALEYVDTLLVAVRGGIDKAQDSLLSRERRIDLPFISVRREKALALFTDLERGQDAWEEEQAFSLLEKQVQGLLDTLEKAPQAHLPPIASFTKVDETLAKVVEELNQVIAQRERLLQLYAPSSMPILAENQRLHRLLSQLWHALLQLRAQKVQTRLRLLREWGQRRDQFYKDLVLEREFSLLQEDLSLRREIYKSLLEKRIQLSIDKEAVVSSFRVSQPPTLSSIPVYPSRIQVYVIALLLGLFIGIGGVILWHLLNQRVSYRIDIEGLSPVPVIGELPYEREQKGLLPFSGLQLEILRSLRNALGFLWDPASPKVVVLTSTVSGEGKTYLARGIAYTYALAGYRVLLVDADLRRGSISQAVGFQEKGLSLLLSASQISEEMVREAIIPLGKEGLYLLPSGPLPPNPAELLESPRLVHLIQILASEYDVFVLDTAPVGLVSDTLGILRGFPSAVTLFVFRADYSRIPFLRHLEEVIKTHHLNKVYLVFNGTKLSKPRYGYGYGYGYYGDGYIRRYYYVGERQRTRMIQRLRELLPI
ncbi:MAG: polysaccharide biosynthesis tyrosine autokinase [Bacteroidia bacterium]|nr:polysaccharide biosynthesis tyrosine autokinase [Bacteroidia bacterium]